MPAMGWSNCMRLGASHPPFVSASKRPVTDIRSPERATPKRLLESITR